MIFIKKYKSKIVKVFSNNLLKTFLFLFNFNKIILNEIKLFTFIKYYVIIILNQVNNIFKYKFKGEI